MPGNKGKSTNSASNKPRSGSSRPITPKVPGHGLKAGKKTPVPTESVPAQRRPSTPKKTVPASTSSSASPPQKGNYVSWTYVEKKSLTFDDVVDISVDLHREAVAKLNTLNTKFKNLCTEFGKDETVKKQYEGSDVLPQFHHLILACKDTKYRTSSAKGWQHLQEISNSRYVTRRYSIKLSGRVLSNLGQIQASLKGTYEHYCSPKKPPDIVKTFIDVLPAAIHILQALEKSQVSTTEGMAPSASTKSGNVTEDESGKRKQERVDHLGGDVKKLQLQNVNLRDEVKQCKDKLADYEKAPAAVDSVKRDVKPKGAGDNTQGSKMQAAKPTVQQASRMKELEAKLQDFESANRKLMERYESKSKESASRIKLLENDKEELLERYERESKERAAIIKNLENDNENLRERLSKEMGAKLSANETDVENISIKHRPMTIVEDYVQLQSEEWFQAKEYLNTAMQGASEERLLTYLYRILKAVDGSVKEVFTNHEKTLTDTLVQQVHSIDPYPGKEKPNAAKDTQKTVDKPPKSKMEKLPLGLANAVGDFMRQNAESCDLQGIVQVIIEKLSNEDSKRKEHLKDPSMQAYIAAAANLCWKMVLQRPPMTFDFSERWLSEKEQDLYWKSQQEKDAKVCVVYPILKHGSKTMGKGKVYLYM